MLNFETPIFRKIEKKYLKNHVIKTKQTYSETECCMFCAAIKSCASVSYKTSGIGKGRCELSNETVPEVPDKVHNPEFIFFAMILTEPVSVKLCVLIVPYS